MYSDYQTWLHLAPTISNELLPLPTLESFLDLSILGEPDMIPMPWLWFDYGSKWQDQHRDQHPAGPSRTRDERRNGRRNAVAPYPQPLAHESLGTIPRDHPIRVGGVRRPPQVSTSNLSKYELGITGSCLNNPAPAPSYGSAVVPSTPTPAIASTSAVVLPTSTPAPSTLTTPTETRKKGKQKLYTHWHDGPDDWDNIDDSDGEDEKLVMKMVTMKINEC